MAPRAPPGSGSGSGSDSDCSGSGSGSGSVLRCAEAATELDAIQVERTTR